MSSLGGLGWYTFDAALLNLELLGATVIEIKTASALGPSTGRQIYGIFENRIGLLRIEDCDGKLIPSRYENREDQIGPSPPKRTKEEWEELLRSSEHTHVLEALTWIAGDHPLDDLGRPEVPFALEYLEYLRLVVALRKSPILQKRKEAAILAQEQLPKSKR